MFKIGPFQYTFKNNSKKIFCRESISISDRELVVISGPSGAGKSTLLQVLKGIIPEYSTGDFEGELFYKNQPLHGESFQKNLKEILFLFQNPFSQLIYPDVAEEFFFSMENFNFTRRQMDQKKEEFNKLFNLENIWNKKTSELSNGECQRLVLSSLLAIDPEVLLLDEPTAFLDPQARFDFYQWLLKIKGSKTIILVDHHLDEIIPIVDKVIHVGQDGEITLKNKLQVLPPRETSYLDTQEIGPQEWQDLKLELSNISFYYPDQQKLLENISLSAASGEVVVIKGKNGKGKSSLLKIIAGILKPLTGEKQILKSGTALPLKNHHNEIGFIFQNPESHFFYDTINEELSSVRNSFEFKNMQNKFFNGIDFTRSPFLLSEGEKRRLSILMTVFLDKPILLYDEPTFGQDQQSIAMIVEMVRDLRSSGKIQIVISHDEKFINSIADSIYKLEDGQLARLK